MKLLEKWIWKTSKIRYTVCGSKWITSIHIPSSAKFHKVINVYKHGSAEIVQYGLEIIFTVQ